jgi:hypothetical protein
MYKRNRHSAELTYSFQNNAARATPSRPTKPEIHTYLCALRDSGVVNMWGAGPYLEERFDMPRAEAKQALLDWIASFRTA